MTANVAEEAKEDLVKDMNTMRKFLLYNVQNTTQSIKRKRQRSYNELVVMGKNELCELWITKHKYMCTLHTKMQSFSCTFWLWVENTTEYQTSKPYSIVYSTNSSYSLTWRNWVLLLFSTECGAGVTTTHTNTTYALVVLFSLTYFVFPLFSLLLLAFATFDFALMLYHPLEINTSKIQRTGCVKCVD